MRRKRTRVVVALFGLPWAACAHEPAILSSPTELTSQEPASSPAELARPAPVAQDRVAPDGIAQSNAQLTAERIDQLLAPLALYPDALLSQVLMACTYPDHVTAAARWSRAHPGASGDEAVRAVEDQPWDASVQSLAAFPQVLAVLDQHPDWVAQVGDAFLRRPESVMDSVQRLRAMARARGTLESNERQQVRVEQLPSTPEQPAQEIIHILPADPTVVYVPMYDPGWAYGAWPYPYYPPVYLTPPYGSYGYAPWFAGVGWGAGIGVHHALWGGFRWRHRGHHDVHIDVNRYNRAHAGRPLAPGQSSWTRANQLRIDQARARALYRPVYRPGYRPTVGAPGAQPPARPFFAPRSLTPRAPGTWSPSGPAKIAPPSIAPPATQRARQLVPAPRSTVPILAPRSMPAMPSRPMMMPSPQIVPRPMAPAPAMPRPIAPAMPRPMAPAMPSRPMMTPAPQIVPRR